jgi:hypothetical protein
MTAHRFSEETLRYLAEIRDVDCDLTGIRPTETAALEAAVAVYWRKKVGRRHADSVPVRSRRKARTR